MDLTAERIDIGTRTPTVLLNGEDAAELGVHALDRIRIRHDGGTTVGIVEVTDELVSPGRLGVTDHLGHVEGEVTVSIAPRPSSVSCLTKKLDDVELEDEEVGAIVSDIEAGLLDDVELTAFVAGVYANGLSRAEMVSLTHHMVDAGERLAWDAHPVADKHSIGGVAGNRVTPVVVPLAVAAGLTVPKTSSRAVTSAAGTADTMEVFCGVEFSLEEVRSIVAETGGCMVWGGAVDLSPVDDTIIRVETPLSLDPPGQLIASVLSKKEAAGSTHVVIDIPFGESAKVASLADARELAEDFSRVGDSLGMTVECAITRGEAPIGRGIGPVLEARDVLSVLDGDGPSDLRAKSLDLARRLFAICDVDRDPAAMLEAGAAREAFDDIVAAQGGDPDVAVEDLQPGRHERPVAADRAGTVAHVDNRGINELARRAGAPRDQGAGVALHVRPGTAVEAGADLYTVHAEKAAKLEEVERFLDRTDPVRIRRPDETLVESV
jgi:AMP phosphorylase